MSSAIDTRTQERYHNPQQDAATAHNRCQVPSGSRAEWCVAATLPKAERRAHASLHRFGFTAYLPLVTTRWRDRTWHTGPLWPGYLFVQLDLTKPWSPVTHCPGVFNLVGINGIPSTCPQGAVEAIQAAEAVRALLPPVQQRWSPGAACALASGPFQDCDAVVLKVGADMALVALMMFGHLREILVQLDCLRARDE